MDHPTENRSDCKKVFSQPYCIFNIQAIQPLNDFLHNNFFHYNYKFGEPLKIVLRHAAPCS